eukprot:GHUV01027748.1.p1 GENE.GHUV01027748.1~~GHUV01027748.1.p1  ORF type:complete len:139 (+),score=13.67 GHUV01027748.1:838-1254(+)
MLQPGGSFCSTLSSGVSGLATTSRFTLDAPTVIFDCLCVRIAGWNGVVLHKRQRTCVTIAVLGRARQAVLMTTESTDGFNGLAYHEVPDFAPVVQKTAVTHVGCNSYVHAVALPRAPPHEGIPYASERFQCIPTAGRL